MEIKNLETEARNPATAHIDTMSTLEMVKTINAEDQKVALAVAGESDQIAKAIRSEERRVGKEVRSRWSPDH